MRETAAARPAPPSPSAASSRSAGEPGKSEAVWPSSPRPSSTRSKRAPGALRGDRSAWRTPRAAPARSGRPPRGIAVAADRVHAEKPVAARDRAAPRAPCAGCSRDRAARRSARRPRRRGRETTRCARHARSLASSAYRPRGVEPPESASLNEPDAPDRGRCRAGEASAAASNKASRLADTASFTARSSGSASRRRRPSRRSACAGPQLPGLVLVDRRRDAEDRLHDLPGALDGVLAREQRRVALHGVAEQAFVGAHRIFARIVHHRELRQPAHHGLARVLDARAERDLDVGAEPEAQVVALPRAAASRAAAGAARRSPRSWSSAGTCRRG